MSKISNGVLTVFNDAAGFHFESIAEAQILWDEVEKFMLEKGYDLQYFVAEYLDTIDREDLMESLGQIFVGRSWPSFGDAEEVSKQFYKDFEAAVLARGITISK